MHPALLRIRELRKEAEEQRLAGSVARNRNRGLVARRQRG